MPFPYTFFNFLSAVKNSWQYFPQQFEQQVQASVLQIPAPAPAFTAALLVTLYWDTQWTHRETISPFCPGTHLVISGCSLCCETVAVEILQRWEKWAPLSRELPGDDSSSQQALKISQGTFPRGKHQLGAFLTDNQIKWKMGAGTG